MGGGCTHTLPRPLNSFLTPPLPCLQHYVSVVQLTALGRVLYQNLMSTLPTLFCMAAFGELRADALSGLTGWPAFWVFMSCLFGFGMSWTAWALREHVSALSFTVIG